ncbi:DNA methyltransferase [Geminocystis herdmanii]|uniref:DNA methyltransferase n=1 Tax=Geminocystis herdmanii TaxID=669359 RepID=UPI0003460378|nr:DNA methyltransferase [Geminocystis herdmanii]
MNNQLFYGDNLDVLRRHIKDESVDLCYIDPPFNSKRNYNQIYNNIGKEDRAQAQAFIDTWTWDDLANIGLAEIKENYHGKFTQKTVDLICGLEPVLGKGSLFAYLVNMTLRIVEIHRVLKPTGSFYLHCDPSASHYLKLVLDAIFCSQKGDFLNEIIWKRTTSHSDAKKRFGRNNDIILFYVKTANNYTWNPQYGNLSDKRMNNYNYQDEDGRLWASGDLTAKGLSGGGYEYEYKGVKNYWRCPLETMKQLDVENRLYFTSKGGIRIKRYLDENKGQLIQQIFDDIPPISSQAKERLGYPTQKPKALLERIIKASSNKGDVILDAFCGCGTTVEVAQLLDRNWIGIDITYQSIGVVIKRLEDSFGKEVLENITLNGIPKDMESAQALALKKDDRTRKEFEKWAVLTYTNNRAIINDKKGADKGIDGIAYFDSGKDKPEKIIIQVKSGKVKSGDIRDLLGTMTINEATLGIFLTLNEPTKDMIKTAKEAGIYQSKFMSNPVDKISIVTIREIIEEQKRLDIRLVLEVLKSAEKQRETKSDQIKINFSN